MTTATAEEELFRLRVKSQSHPPQTIALGAGVYRIGSSVRGVEVSLKRAYAAPLHCALWVEPRRVRVVPFDGAAVAVGGKEVRDFPGAELPVGESFVVGNAVTFELLPPALPHIEEPSEVERFCELRPPATTTATATAAEEERRKAEPPAAKPTRVAIKVRLGPRTLAETEAPPQMTPAAAAVAAPSLPSLKREREESPVPVPAAAAVAEVEEEPEMQQPSAKRQQLYEPHSRIHNPHGGDDDDDDDDDGGGEEEEDDEDFGSRRRSRSRSRSRAKPAASAADISATGRRIIKRLNADENFEYWFDAPMWDEEEARNTWGKKYRRVIKHPMCFQFVLKKLDEGRYTSTAAFAADMKLIHQNCVKYNGTEDTIGAIAKQYISELSRMLEEEGIKEEATPTKRGRQRKFTPAVEPRKTPVRLTRKPGTPSLSKQMMQVEAEAKTNAEALVAQGGGDSFDDDDDDG